MQYRKDARSGNLLSALGFGCMRFPSSHEAAEALVMEAIRQGVNYFDTAYLYPGNEEKLGRILADNSAREKVFLATKLPVALCRSEEDFDRFFEKQLGRLQTDHIDYYLLHMLTDRALFEKLRGLQIERWIEKKKASGAISQIGFSFHGPGHEFMALLDAYDWDFCQIQYNYSDENFQAGVKGLRKAAEKNIPVIIMEPLLGGKLVNRLPKEAEEMIREVDPALSPAAFALRWLFDQGEATVVLSGMNSLKQLGENVQVAEHCAPGALTEREREAYVRARGALAKEKSIACTGCAYCMPCPHHVNIPGCFSAYNADRSLGRRTGLMQYMQSTGALSGAEGSASNCTGCGACEPHCPQNIPIRESLRLVRRRMEPWWFSGGVSVARAFLSRKKRGGKAQ